MRSSGEMGGCISFRKYSPPSMNGGSESNNLNNTYRCYDQDLYPPSNEGGVFRSFLRKNSTSSFYRDQNLKSSNGQPEDSVRKNSTASCVIKTIMRKKSMSPKRESAVSCNEHQGGSTPISQETGGTQNCVLCTILKRTPKTHRRYHQVNVSSLSSNRRDQLNSTSEKEICDSDNNSAPLHKVNALIHDRTADPHEVLPLIVSNTGRDDVSGAATNRSSQATSGRPRWAAPVSAFLINPTHIIKSPLSLEEDIPKADVATYFLQMMESYGNKTCMVDGLRSLTYQELHKQTLNLSNHLYTRGLTSRTCMAICCSNLLEYPALVLACARLGGVVAVMVPDSSADVLLQQLQQCDATFLVTDSCFLDKFAPIIKLLNNLREVFVVGQTVPGCTSVHELLKQNLDGGFVTLPVILPEDDVFCISFTRNATGTGTKAAALTHKNVLTNLRQISIPQLDPPKPDDVVLSTVAYSHVFGLFNGLLLPLSCGAAVVPLQDGTTTHDMLNTIKKLGVTMLYTVPACLETLAGYTKTRTARLSTVRHVTTSLYNLRNSVRADFTRATGIVSVNQVFTMAELGVGLSHVEGISDAESIGVPLPGTECKIVDRETKMSLPADKLGELFLRGPQVMSRYWVKGQGSETALSNGWIGTGDLAYYNKTDCFYIEGKIKKPKINDSASTNRVSDKSINYNKHFTL